MKFRSGIKFFGVVVALGMLGNGSIIENAHATLENPNSQEVNTAVDHTDVSTQSGTPMKVMTEEADVGGAEAEGQKTVHVNKNADEV